MLSQGLFISSKGEKCSASLAAKPCLATRTCLHAPLRVHNHGAIPWQKVSRVSSSFSVHLRSLSWSLSLSPEPQDSHPHGSPWGLQGGGVSRGGLLMGNVDAAPAHPSAALSQGQSLKPCSARLSRSNDCVITRLELKPRYLPGLSPRGLGLGLLEVFPGSRCTETHFSSLFLTRRVWRQLGNPHYCFSGYITGFALKVNDSSTPSCVLCQLPACH